MKNNLRYQRNLFWEDLDDDIDIIKQYFNICIIDPQKNLIADSTEVPFSYRCSIAIAQRNNIFEKFTNALEWAGKLRKEMIDPYHIFTDMDFCNQLFKNTEASSTTNKKFVRPAAGTKIFAGNVYDRSTFQNEVDFLKQKNVDPRTVMCLVSTPAEIKLEYRTIFIDGEYISGSRYMCSGELNVNNHVPTNAQTYARTIHKTYDLPPWMILDIADLYGEDNPEHYRVVEINQIETSSFYAADLEKIYSTWSSKLS